MRYTWLSGRHFCLFIKWVTLPGFLPVTEFVVALAFALTTLALAATTLVAGVIVEVTGGTVVRGSVGL